MNSGPVLVTGAAGFAGGHLVEQLAGQHEIVGWTRSLPPPDIARFATWKQIDLLDRAAVRRAIAELRPSAVYHCAGLPHVADSWQHSTEALSTNVFVTHHLLDALRRSGNGCRVLIPGSATVYASSSDPITEEGRLAPANPYAVSKLAQEQLGIVAFRDDGIEVVVTRSFNHTGPRQSSAFAAPNMARQIALIEAGAMEPTIKVGNLDAMRDLTDVRDTVRAYAQLMKLGRPGIIYNVASGVGRTIRSVLDALIARARAAVSIEIDPAQLRPADIPVLVGDSARLRGDTGWTPRIPFEQTLDDLLDYWRSKARRQI